MSVWRMARPPACRAREHTGPVGIMVRHGCSLPKGHLGTGSRSGRAEIDLGLSGNGPLPRDVLLLSAFSKEKPDDEDLADHSLCDRPVRLGRPGAKQLGAAGT